MGDVTRRLDWSGTPVPKGRPRVGNGRAFTPRRTKTFEAEFGWAWRMARPEQPFDCAVAVHLEIREAPRGTQQQGDLDNYAKSILDALNTIAYVDDRQIVRLEIDMKRASADPGVSVEIWRYEDDE